MISGSHEQQATINVARRQADITMFVADAARDSSHNGLVLSHTDLLAELVRLKADKATTNAQLARLLKLPTSRIAEIFDGKRLIRVDEMKCLVEEFDLDGRTRQPSAETIEPILDAILPLAPPRLTDQSRRALAEALSYGLGLLAGHPASRATAETLQVAARAAATRFRETATLS